MASKRKMLTAGNGQVISYHKFYATLDQRLYEIISDLSNPSTSDEQRSQAKSEFNLCKENGLNTVVDKLLILLEHPPNIDVLKMSATLLGDIFEKSKSTQTRVKWRLLDCVVKEKNRPIIEILGHAISKLETDRKVANTLLERLESDDTSVQEPTLLIFPQLMQYVYDCNVLFTRRLRIVLMTCLGNVGSANVRIAALIAATSFIQWSMSDVDWFQNLLPGMMQCLVEVLNGGDEAMKQKALVLLVKLAETKLSFFRGQLVEVFGSMLQIAETESLEEGTRNLAIEFVISLVKLIQTMSNNRGPDIHVLAMSAVLLGNLFKQCHPMSKSTDSRVKGYLLACVLNEENKPIIEILGHTISKLAPDNNFANLLLVNVATNLQESALLIFPHVMQYLIASKKVSNVQMASDVQFESCLRTVFKKCLGKLGSANERIAALIAATSFIQCVKSSSYGDWFQGLLMQCLNESFNGGDEAMTQKAFVLLIELAETKPSFFTEHLVEKVGSMSQIAEAENLEEGTRRLAKKFAITLEAHAPDTSMPDMLEIVGNLRQFRLQEGIASDQTRTPAIEKLLRQFEEKLPPNTWASRWSSLRLKSILARKEN